MELTVTLEIKQETYEYKGRSVEVLNAYVSGEYLTGMGFATVPFLEQALVELTKEIVLEGIDNNNVTVKIKTPKKLLLGVQGGVYFKFLHDEVFKDIIFLT